MGDGVRIAIIYCLLGEKDNAFNWLAQAEREHAVGLPSCASTASGIATLDPRFKDLLTMTDRTIP